jgi:hypothetical protein
MLDSAYFDADTGAAGTQSKAAIERQKKEEKRLQRKLQKKREKEMKKATGKSAKETFKKPAKPWFASKEQEEERKRREDKMSLAELAEEAVEWSEEIDPMTGNILYLNVNTNEMMNNVPRSLAAKRQLEFENSKRKREFDFALARIRKLEFETKNRLLITGGRKK